MITQEEYEAAREQHKIAEKLMNEYHRQRIDEFFKRMRENPIFTDDELVYSAFDLCPCGHGIAYPKDCGSRHYWDCSAILKGIQINDVKHCDRLPFAYYSVISEQQVERAGGRTTRPRVKP